MSTSPSLRTRTESFADGLTIRFNERANNGRPALILHGGGGVQTVVSIAAGLDLAHTVVPTHPGFSGTPRPEWFDTIDDLAFAYLDLLDRLDLRRPPRSDPRRLRPNRRAGGRARAGDGLTPIEGRAKARPSLFRER